MVLSFIINDEMHPILTANLLQRLSSDAMFTLQHTSRYVFLMDTSMRSDGVCNLFCDFQSFFTNKLKFLI